jgi:uncharacterized membrane-anchored protein YjiN (DUF445 family)
MFLFNLLLWLVRKLIFLLAWLKQPEDPEAVRYRVVNKLSNTYTGVDDKDIQRLFGRKVNVNA